MKLLNKNLVAGNVIECSPLLSNLSKENVIMIASIVTKETVVFDVYYYGIYLGTKRVVQKEVTV